jgi:tetratricopeptide (TPR) repeat protein
MPLIAAWILLSMASGCAAPADPPAHETAGPALEKAGVIKTKSQVKSPTKEKLTPEQEEAAEEAQMERKIRSMAHYAAATAHRERGEEQEALNEYYQAALADPSNQKMVMEVVQMLAAVRQRDKAFKLLVEATKNPAATAGLHALLAATYLEKKNPELAKAAANHAIKKSPKSIVGYSSLMQVFKYEIRTGAKRVRQIRELLDRATAQKDTAIPFQIGLALMMAEYLSINKESSEELRPKVRKMLDKAWASKPKKPVELEQIARGYRLAGAHKQAAEAMEALLKVLPNNPMVLLETAREHAMGGDMDQAKLHLDAMIKKFPRVWEGHQLRAAIAMDQEDYTLAAKHYREVIKLNRRLESVYYDLVSALLADKQFKEARDALSNAKSKFKINFMQPYFSAMIYLEAKDYAKAHEELLNAEELAKKTEPSRLTHILYFQLGSTAERAKKYKDAEKFFRHSIKLKPDYATSLNYLGYMWADRNENLAEAEEFIRRALKITPDNPAYMDSLAWVFFRRGEFNDALKWQLKAHKQSKEPDPEVLLHLGMIYAALKDKKRARKYILEASKIEDIEADIRAKIQAELKSLD